MSSSPTKSSEHSVGTTLVNVLKTKRHSERTVVLLAITGSTTYGIITNSI